MWGVGFFFCPDILGTYFFQKTFGLTTCLTVGRMLKACARNRLSAVTNFTRRFGSSFLICSISSIKKSSAMIPCCNWTFINDSASWSSFRSVSTPLRPSKTRRTSFGVLEPPCRPEMGRSFSASLSPSRGSPCTPRCPKKLFPSINQVVGRFVLLDTWLMVSALALVSVPVRATAKRNDDRTTHPETTVVTRAEFFLDGNIVTFLFVMVCLYSR
mmetsp:Transcript_3251/g.7407  ORF Transcript_3251/g.7407 Transcript_3251/m.7407 type:complete len:214 (+) Transcript_3251:362-1003(+)